MNRTQKKEFVSNLNKDFNESDLLVVTQYSGLDVKKMEELRSKMRDVDVKFKVTKSSIAELIDNDILIWTTTPWTMPGNRALAYSANLKYTLIQIIEINDSSIAKIGDKIMIAKDLQDSVIKEIGVTKTKVIKSFLGILKEKMLF